MASWTPRRRLRQKTSVFDCNEHPDLPWEDCRTDSPNNEAMDDCDVWEPGDTYSDEAPEIPASPCERCSSLRARAYGLDPIDFRRMLRAQVPPIVFNIMFWMWSCAAIAKDRDLDVAEMFAGVAQVVRGIVAAGFAAEPYDIEIKPHEMNLMSDVGFLCATMILIARVAGGGVIHWANVCSTCLWLCRCTTQRSDLQPLGAQHIACVHKANVMVSRMAALLLWIHNSGRLWVLEQPASSLMALHPRMQHVRRCIRHWTSVMTYMGYFGAPSLKLTRLLSDHPLICRLHRKRPRTFEASHALVLQYKDNHGTRRVAGNHALKGPQAYPPGYGDAFAETFMDMSYHTGIHGLEGCRLASTEDISEEEYDMLPEASDWPGLEFNILAARLNLPTDRLLV